MKTFVIILVAALFASVPLASGFAQDETTNTETQLVNNEDVLRGRIESIDPVKNEIVIRQLSTGEERTFKVTPEELADLTVGKRVRIQFDPETNTAESVKSTVFKNGRWWNY